MKHITNDTFFLKDGKAAARAKKSRVEMSASIAHCLKVTPVALPSKSPQSQNGINFA